MNIPLKPCPFCNGTDLGVTIIDRADSEGIPMAYSCPDCGAHGPWSYGKNEYDIKQIAEEWNKRTEPSGLSTDFVCEYCNKPGGVLYDGEWTEDPTGLDLLTYLVKFYCSDCKENTHKKYHLVEVKP